jgi:hypothetical protein
MQYIVCFAQKSSIDDPLQTLIKVEALKEKKIEFNRRTNGESDGYRIKIHFSGDKSKARLVQNEFNAKYSDVMSYEEYQQPNFVINVGDFKTKLEAYQFLKKVQLDFPYAFIVKSKIKFIKLN